MQLGVLGLIVTSLVTAAPSTIISLYWIKKHYELTVEWHSSAKILLSSAIAATSTYLLISELSFSSLIRLIIGVVFFACVFVAMALVTQTINKSDVENLRGHGKRTGSIWQNTKPRSKLHRKTHKNPQTLTRIAQPTKRIHSLFDLKKHLSISILRRASATCSPKTLL